MYKDLELEIMLISIQDDFLPKESLQGGVGEAQKRSSFPGNIPLVIIHHTGAGRQGLVLLNPGSSH